MDWVGLGETIAGGVGAFFTGGATLPLVAAGIQHMANSGAANTQTQASQAVQGQNQQMYQGQNAVGNQIYQGQQANLAPYTSLGGGAAGLLGKGLGINVAPAPITPIQPTPSGAAPGIQYPQPQAPDASRTTVAVPPTPGVPQGSFGNSLGSLTPQIRTQ